jgi:flagellin-like hook-associated protein FlgL
VDKGLLTKGNQPIRPQSRGSPRQTDRASQAKPQTQNQKIINLPIHALLTAEFNPIFDEMLDWMQRVRELSVLLRTTPPKDPSREPLQDELEWLLTQIEVRSGAIVEQLEELSE